MSVSTPTDEGLDRWNRVQGGLEGGLKALGVLAIGRATWAWHAGGINWTDQWDVAKWIRHRLPASWQWALQLAATAAVAAGWAWGTGGGASLCTPRPSRPPLDPLLLGILGVHDVGNTRVLDVGAPRVLYNTS